jgi:hypothetical protein
MGAALTSHGHFRFWRHADVAGYDACSASSKMTRNAIVAIFCAARPSCRQLAVLGCREMDLSILGTAAVMKGQRGMAAKNAEVPQIQSGSRFTSVTSQTTTTQ